MQYASKLFMFVIPKHVYCLKNQVLSLTGNTSPVRVNSNLAAWHLERETHVRRLLAGYAAEDGSNYMQQLWNIYRLQIRRLHPKF